MFDPAPKVPRIIALLVLVASFSTVSSSQEVRGHRPPQPFQRFAVSPSAPVRFLLSDRGRELLRHSPAPQAASIRRALEETSPALAPVAPAWQVTPSTATVGTTCGTSGTKFNREGTTNALPQNEESLDFMQNRVAPGTDLVVGGANDYRGMMGGLGNSMTGYYIQRTNADCNPEADGGLPALANPNNTAAQLFGGGDPVVAADPARDAVFMADLRFDETATAVGIFRTSAANLMSGTACPTGTHTAAQSATCWPQHRLVATKPGTFQQYFEDKPHLAVDERQSGTGAGRIYVTGTLFDFVASTSRIWIVGCANDLSSCSAPAFVSGTDMQTQMSHVSVRPDGGITVSYVNILASGDAVAIRYARCTTATPPAAPTCTAPVTVFNESKAIVDGYLGSTDFDLITYPKHAHRTDSNGTETYMVWERCKAATLSGVTCMDSDVVLAASNNNGATWSAPVVIDSASGSQFFCWIAADKSIGTINIAYYSATESWRHRFKVMLVQIPAGAATPDAGGTPQAVTSGTNEPDADPFLGGMFVGDYIGIAARGSTASGQSVVYVGYTWNSRNGSYNGATNGQQDNRISRLTY
jgi:hypothetical protein